MMDPRPAGLLIAVVGAVGTAVAALADPLGIGEGNVFGWLQITGTIIGALVTLMGLVIAMEWVPWFPARREDTVVRGSGGAQTNIVTSSKSEPQTNVTESDPEHEEEQEHPHMRR